MERGKSSGLVKLADDLVRQSPFIITGKQDSFLRHSYVRECGGSLVITDGLLFEEDRGTFLCIYEMAKQHNYEPFEFTLSDIAKLKGVKNPYQESTLTPIRESIDRLLESSLRIRPKNGIKGLTAKFYLVTGWLDSDDTGKLSVSPYLTIVKDYGLKETILSLFTYLKVKSQIARGLYSFLISQQDFYNGKGYSIRLSKLVNHLNYETDNRSWWMIWPNFKKGIEELKQFNFIGAYKYEKARCKSDGGVLTFYSGKKNQPAISTGEKNNELVDLIRIEFPIDVANENKLRAELNKLEAFVKPFGRSLKCVISDYCIFLKDQNLRFFSVRLFNPDNSFFQDFFKDIKEKHQSNPEYTNIKPLSPEDTKDLEKRQAEHKKKIEKLRKLCPQNHIFGKDYDYYEYEEECGNCTKITECKSFKMSDLFSE